MRAWIFAAALTLFAAPAFAEDLAPPTPEGTAVRIAADQNGQSVDAADGDAIAVELQSSPSTGSSWRVAEKPDFLTDNGQLTGPVIAAAPGARPLLGAPRWQVFQFTVSGAGSGALTIEKHGPGAASPVLDTFTVTITAQ